MPRRSHRIVNLGRRILLGAPALLALPAAAFTKPIRIGRSLPLTGTIANYAAQRMAGQDLYLKHVSASGGLAGRPLELLTVDDRYETNQLRRNVEMLDTRGVQALFGFIGPAVGQVVPDVEGRRIALIAATTPGSLRQPPHRYVFPMRAGFAEEANAIVRHLVTLGHTRIGVLAQDIELGAAGAAPVGAALAAYNRRPELEVVLANDPASTQRAAQRIASAGCQAVIASGTASWVAAVLRACARLNQRPALFTFAAVNTSQLVLEAGALATGVGVSQVVPHPGLEKYAVVRQYKRLIEENADVAPTVYGMEGFLEAKLLVHGLQKALSDGRDLTRESVANAFDTLGTADLGGYLVKYGRGDRTGGTFVDMTFISSGGTVRS